MEVVYLLFSILSTFLCSLALSLLLPLQSLLCGWRLLFSNASSASDAADPVALYQGTVWHERRRPVLHSFRYSVRYALVDLDRALRPPPDHLSAAEARRITETTGPVFLLTIPASVGYEQNPLSLYYCYDLEDSGSNLKKCIAEVTNTPWGERVSFVFDPNSDVVAKPLHVSPFMDMLASWSIKTNCPGDDLVVAISVKHPTLGNYFTATLTARKVSSSLVSNHVLFFWLMPHKVAIWIYWHALKLWWKGVPFIQHPRYSNPVYREEALSRDHKLNCCQAIGGEEGKQKHAERRNAVCLTRDENLNFFRSTGGQKVRHLQVGTTHPGCPAEENGSGRWFAWRDAKWPWT